MAFWSLLGWFFSSVALHCRHWLLAKVLLGLPSFLNLVYVRGNKWEGLSVLSLSKYVHYYSTFYYHCFLGAALDVILIVETKYLIKAA